jgi:hypothetical protein
VSWNETGPAGGRPAALTAVPPASIGSRITWADNLQDIGRLVATEYSDGKGPFQERAHLVALSFAFLWDDAEFVRRWALWAQEEVRLWPGGERHSDVFRRALRGGPVLGGPGGPD